MLTAICRLFGLTVPCRSECESLAMHNGLRWLISKRNEPGFWAWMKECMDVRDACELERHL